MKIMEKKVKPIRHFNENGHLVGYADENYAFTCNRTADGEMVDYQNTKEKLAKSIYGDSNY